MDLLFPDTPEYHFILKGLCSGQFPAYPKFLCNPASEFDERLEGEIVFSPAPLAILNSDRYLALNTGNIFSYFSGPIVLSTEKDNDKLFVRESDFVSPYYAKFLLEKVHLEKGDSFPAILEPRLALLTAETGYQKNDLYKTWESTAPSLPFPLYMGLIRKDLKDLKGIVEDALKSSIRYSFDHSSAVVKDIATLFFIENSELLKRVIFNFVNKNTISIGEDEKEALKSLKVKMENHGYPVSDIDF